jgi:hypothetical protein
MILVQQCDILKKGECLFTNGAQRFDYTTGMKLYNGSADI